MSAKPTALGGSKPLLAGGAVGIPLAAGQEIVGYYDITSSTPGSITIPANSTALVFLWGATASITKGGAQRSGSGGAGASFRRLQVSFGQVISYALGAFGAVTSAIGNPGGDSVVTLPNGRPLAVTGSQPGATNVAGAAPGGVGGIASGGDLNRTGGTGGAIVASVGQDGLAGDHGSVGGVGASAEAGGGGSAGFSDLPGASLMGTAGQLGGSVASSGGLGGNGGGPLVLDTVLGNGSNARLLVILVRAA